MATTELLVHAGPHPRRDCPVVADLPCEKEEHAASVVLTTPAGERLPAQIVPLSPLSVMGDVGDRLRVAFILPSLEAGEVLALRAEMGREPQARADRVVVSDDGRGSAHVTVDGGLLTVYRYIGDPARPCFFPLLAPGGKHLTRSWPVADDVPGEPQDHPHHRSMWVAHGDVNGTDNWSEQEGHAFQLHRGMLDAAGGPVCGRLAALNDWTDHRKRKILEERRALTAYAVSGDARMFDLDVCFTATECDVRFGDTKEGGILALRVSHVIDGDHGGRIRNSYGAVGEAECWGRRADWCDYSGEIDGEPLGIAIFDHPRSFRHPTFWHVRDYGMYTANPFGWHDFYADPAADGSHVVCRGASLHFHYRVYLHRGDAAAAGVADRYHDYANPPQVELVA
jgi:hypothetical protein